MNINSINANIPLFKESFNNAKPFRHLVIDNFLDEDLAEKVYNDFPSPDAMDIHGRNSNVLVGWQINPLSPNYTPKPSLDALFDYLRSQKLREAIGLIAGIDTQILSDPDYVGSGLLLAPRGGVHRVHADRTYHLSSGYFPRLVLLLYFNKDWSPEYGGGLQLWDRKIKSSITIEPLFNRCVLFEISSTSFHSIEDVVCPDGIYRRALNYYYLSDQFAPNSYFHDTIFMPRDGERLSYWKNRLKTNFPFGLLGTIASRSSITRDIYASTRRLLKGSSGRVNPLPNLGDIEQRWSKFNNNV